MPVYNHITPVLLTLLTRNQRFSLLTAQHVRTLKVVSGFEILKHQEEKLKSFCFLQRQQVMSQDGGRRGLQVRRRVYTPWISMRSAQEAGCQCSLGPCLSPSSCTHRDDRFFLLPQLYHLRTPTSLHLHFSQGMYLILPCVLVKYEDFRLLLSRKLPESTDSFCIGLLLMVSSTQQITQ